MATVFERSAFEGMSLAAVLVTVLLAGTLAAGDAAAQGVTKVKYAEVGRTVLNLPKYVALTNGYFKEQGIEVDLTTTKDGDKATTMLLSGKVDVVLQGPEAAIHVENGPSPEKTKMFTAVTATDGLFLMSRDRIGMDKFDWGMLKGQTVMGRRPGSTPRLFLEYAMKKQGIDPRLDVTLTSISAPARVGAWMSNKASFSVFFEPYVSRLSREGIAYPVASIGKEVGPVDYTVFMATDSYIEENPKIIQGWANAIHKAQKWVREAKPKEAAETIAKWFPTFRVEDIAASIERYRKIGLWKNDPTTSKQAITNLQDILIEGGVLKKTQWVPYDRVVLTTFSEAAKKNVE